MSFFTNNQIAEIWRRISYYISVKDSQLDDAGSITGDEYVTVVQNGENRKVTLRALKAYMIGNLLSEDSDQTVPGSDEAVDGRVHDE